MVQWEKEIYAVMCIVTEEAATEGGYEASNGLFGPEAGRLLVEGAHRLLRG